MCRNGLKIKEKKGVDFLLVLYILELVCDEADSQIPELEIWY